MNKRFQIFVSSTFADLQEERQQVIQALMEMDCIPAGMEVFPAADEDQWQFIRRVIDDCDYYLLIIGGRYGSTDAEGVSYTEKEYDYAVESGLKVIALLHEDPSQIQAGKTDQNAELAERLAEFREKVAEGRLVKFWKSADQLPGMVALSLSKTIKTYPAVGWVRADSVAPQELLVQLNDLRTENGELKKRLDELSNEKPLEIPNLAGLDDKFQIEGTFKREHLGREFAWLVDLSWSEIFALISPYLIEHPSDSSVSLKLRASAFALSGEIGRYDRKIDEQCFQTVKIQLVALGLVRVRYVKTTKGNMGLFWSLTPQGERLMMQLRTAKKDA